MKKVNIFGINITDITKDEIWNEIRRYLGETQQRIIVTPNPEILLSAKKDEELFYILNQADLAILDGFGLKIAGLLMGKNILRYPGADLVEDLLKFSQGQKKKVLVLNWEEGLSSASEIKKALLEKFPSLEVLALDVDRSADNLNLQAAVQFAPDIMLVCLGSPWQEKAIYHHQSKIPSLRISVGIGGSLDFVTGQAKRAPKIFRSIGLEWLWRLLQQKKVSDRKVFLRQRLYRIGRAVIVFPFVFFVWRFINPFIYRPNIACILYKQEEGRRKILILRRSDRQDHWQLPQGGTDGQALEVAGKRELKEELGIENFQVKAVFKNVWRYRFGEGKLGYPTQKHTGYKGQKQSLCIAEFFGKDEEIKINFWDHVEWKWVDREDLVESVHPLRRESAKIFIDKFNSLKI